MSKIIQILTCPMDIDTPERVMFDLALAKVESFPPASPEQLQELGQATLALMRSARASE